MKLNYANIGVCEPLHPSRKSFQERFSTKGSLRP